MFAALVVVQFKRLILKRAVAGSFLLLVLYCSSLIVCSETEPNSGNCLPLPFFSTSSRKRWDRVWVKVKSSQKILRMKTTEWMRENKDESETAELLHGNEVKRRLSENNYPFTSEGTGNKWWRKMNEKERETKRELIREERTKEPSPHNRLQTHHRAYCSTSIHAQKVVLKWKISGWGSDVKTAAKCTSDYVALCQ